MNEKNSKTVSYFLCKSTYGIAHWLMKKGINSKTPTNKKIAVEDLFAAAQNKFRTSESAQSTLLVYDGKIDHPDGISSDYSDGEEDDFSLKSSSRSQFWYGKQGKLYAASDNTSVSSSDSTSTTTSRYITPKELVHEITYRVQNHLAPPEYGIDILFDKNIHNIMKT